MCSRYPDHESRADYERERTPNEPPRVVWNSISIRSNDEFTHTIIVHQHRKRVNDEPKRPRPYRHLCTFRLSGDNESVSVFVDGEPVLSGGRGQSEWQAAIRRATSKQPLNPTLTFIVSELRRRGQPFDLDNLVHPVLMVFEEPVDTVSARLVIGTRPGLVIQDARPAPPPTNSLRNIYVDSPSEVSGRDRPGIPQIKDDPVFDEHLGLGLALDFDRGDIPIRRGWFGPTEAIVDDLTPWFGTYTRRDLIADHRLRDFRVTRGANPTRSGVSIAVWYVPDSEVASSP